MKIILTVHIPILSTEALEGSEIQTNYFRGIRSLLGQYNSTENNSPLLQSQNVKKRYFSSSSGRKKKIFAVLLERQKKWIQRPKNKDTLKQSTNGCLKKRLLLLLQIGHLFITPQPYSLKKWNLFLYFPIPSEVLHVLLKGTFLSHSAKPTSHSWAADKNENCCWEKPSPWAQQRLVWLATSATNLCGAQTSHYLPPIAHLRLMHDEIENPKTGE